MNRETALRILGADVCVPDDGMLTGTTSASHLFAADDSLHKMCAPSRKVNKPFVLSGSERPTCVKCRAKYDAAVEVVNSTKPTVTVVELLEGDVVVIVKNGVIAGTIHTDGARGAIVGRSIRYLRKEKQKYDFGFYSSSGVASGSGGYEIKVTDPEHPDFTEVLDAIKNEVGA